MPLKKYIDPKKRRSVNTRGGGADAGIVGKLRDAGQKAKKVMGRKARPKMTIKRKPMTPLKRKS